MDTNNFLSYPTVQNNCPEGYTLVYTECYSVCYNLAKLIEDPLRYGMVHGLYFSV